MKYPYLILLSLLAMTSLASAEKLTGDKLILKNPVSLTYDFSVEGGDMDGTRGVVTLQGHPSKTVGVQGQVSYKDDKGKTISEQFQGNYRSLVEKPVFLDMIREINFGSLSDPKCTDGTLYTRVVIITHFASSAMLSATILPTLHDLKPGIYKDPLSSDKLQVSEQQLLNTPVWMVSQKLGPYEYKAAVRQDNGLPYYYQMTSTDKSGPTKIVVKIRSARL